MSREQHLIDEIAKDLSDPLPKLVYADYLDERSDERAGWWRWCAETGVRPRFNKFNDKRWDWDAGKNSVLPAALRFKIWGYGPGYPTALDAMLDAADAWASLAPSERPDAQGAKL